MANSMKQHKDILVKLSFEKADEALRSAKLNIDNNLLTAAQNRIYYALFYSVLALGYSNGFVTGKHGQLLGWFNKVFIHEKRFSLLSFLHCIKRLLRTELKVITNSRGNLKKMNY